MKYTVISVSAHKMRGILNSLHGRGVDISRGRVEGERWIFSVPQSATDTTVKLLDGMDADYTVVRYGGAKRLKTLVAVNLGLIIACVAAIVVAAVCSLYVFGTDISGEEQLAEQARIVLAEQGLDKAAISKRDIDIQSVKDALYAGVDRLAFVSVKLRGSRLKVTMVAEKSVLPEHEKYKAIYAERDGIVTSVTVLSGTALVKEGDRVLKGDLLIEGKRAVGVDEMGEEIYEECPASGSVQARAWISSRTSLTSSYTTFVRTGNAVKSRYLTFFGKPIGKDQGCEYALYEREVRSVKSYSLLPFEVVEVTYYETQTVVRELSEGEINAAVFEESRRLRETVDESVSIINDRNSVKRLDNLYIIDIYYEIVKDIAVGA